MPDVPSRSLRFGLVVIGLGIWFLTQHLIRFRPTGSGVIGDGLHTLTARIFRLLRDSPRAANVLLILSALGIDGLGGFILWQSVLGPSIRPFIGLLFIFGLRQICQALCALPPPEGMIWRSPGVPSLLVTYGVSNDLFFSGHTALTVYGAIELGLWGGPTWAVVGGLIALFEITTVIVLRAHYTMDIFAGAMTAIVAVWFADACAPACDSALIRLGHTLGL